MPCKLCRIQRFASDPKNRKRRENCLRVRVVEEGQTVPLPVSCHVTHHRVSSPRVTCPLPTCEADTVARREHEAVGEPLERLARHHDHAAGRGLHPGPEAAVGQRQLGGEGGAAELRTGPWLGRGYVEVTLTVLELGSGRSTSRPGPSAWRTVTPP